MSIPSKASQILTFFKLEPFILMGITDPLSENYRAFKLMRRIVMLTFSKKLSETALDSLRDSITDFLIEWNQSYAEIHGFVPNLHFLTHLVEDIKLFGHPTEFSCMRYEAKHQQFKRISKKKQGFKGHQKTIIHTFIGSQNLKVKSGNFLLNNLPWTMKRNDCICVLQNQNYTLINNCKDGKYDGYSLALDRFDENYMCYRATVTDQEVQDTLPESPTLCQAIRNGSTCFLITDIYV